MAFDYKKFINLYETRYEKEILDKLTNKYYEEYKRAFETIIPEKMKEFMNEALDTFYMHPEGRIYKRTNQFSSGRGMFDVNISSDGRVYDITAGEGFPSYPVIKGIRWKVFDGDTAWEYMFEYGLHGAGRFYIGMTNPSPFQIVDKKLSEELDILGNDVWNDVLNKYTGQYHDEIVGNYFNQCLM